MKKYSFNEAREIGEIGNTSSWAINFRPLVGSNINSVSSLNLIKKSFFPASDVDYNQLSIKTHNLTIGPNIPINIPISCDDTLSIKVTFYDTEIKQIRGYIKDWVVSHTSLKTKRQAPKNLKDIAVIMNVFHYNKKLELLGDMTDSLIVVPDQTLDFHGDTTYNLDTNVLTFNVVGKS